MTTLTRDDVRKIAHLARLELTEEEVGLYQKRLTAVLAYVETLDELQLDDVPPTTHAVAQVNILRDDQANATMPQADALANAAQTQDGQFAIQAVFE
ncbi:MAG: Asp-tRNA(Asn)/Glu-tRNA(Gln) amidotransferase subunit GatC [Anaerolineales bacterium]|nr:Asp-tRNA(Asn)/Glu-tRNA(Gln) amidotransferase subunit GatC [Anaerolineales bacterium]